MKCNVFFNKGLLKVGSIAVFGVLLSLLFALSVFAAPNAPTGLHQTNAGLGSATVEWSPVPGKKIHYQVDYSLDNKTWIHEVTGFHSSNFDVLMGLDKGSTYYVRVRAYEYKGIPSYVESDYGPWSASLQVVTNPDPAFASWAYQTNATSTSVSFAWNQAKGANRYKVCLYENWEEISTLYTDTNSITVGGLKPGKSYRFTIRAQNVISGYTAVAGSYGPTYDMKTLPSTVQNFKLDYGLPSSSKAYVKWDNNISVDGYQIEVYNTKNKKIKTVNTNRYTSSERLSGISRTGFHKIRIRAYIKLKSGKKMYAAAWATTYISNQPKVIRKKSGSYIKTSWKKVTGATSYSVYISTRQKSGFKLAGTTRRTDLTIRKYGKSKLKKGRTYYIYTVSNKKVGSKTYKSGVSDSYSIRL